MDIVVQPTRSQLRVFSAVCANFVAGWLAANFVTRDLWTLISNLIFAMISWKLAVAAEKILEAYD